MVDLLASVGRLLAALFLVVLNGFFVASEFALVRVRSTSVDQMVDEGRAGSATLQEALGNLDDYLAATQLGITVASLSLGWIGEPAIAALIEPILGTVLPPGTTHLVAVAIGFSVVTFLHVVFGELAPKTIAIAEAERLAILISPPMKFFYYLFLPGLVVFNGTANLFTGLIGIPPASETEETLSEEEIRMILSRSGREGDVDHSEVEMIEQVFELDDLSARDVMVPLPDVVSISEKTPLSELHTYVIEHGHTRYPVVDSEDEPVGYIDTKDILRATATEDGSTTAAENVSEVTAGTLARELPLVPETTSIDKLLEEFQTEQRQMAAVIDEWGSLEGIVTVEDVIEVIVGDIRDKFDREDGEPSVQTTTVDGHEVHVADGQLAVQKLNDTIGTGFERTVYATVGGLILDGLGKPPEVGDSISVDGYTLEVDAVDGARIETVLVHPPESTPEDDTEAE